MSWTCTSKQSRVLSGMVSGSGSKWEVEWDQNGRSYGTPEDIAVPVDLKALSGRAVGRVYVHPEGELTGDVLAVRLAKDLLAIGAGKPCPCGNFTHDTNQCTCSLPGCYCDARLCQ